MAGVVGAAIVGIIELQVLAVAMTVAGVALRIPQLVKLTRTASVDGVSSATWVLGAATAGCWLVVSVSRGATAVAVANVTALVATLVLLATLVWRRRTQR